MKVAGVVLAGGASRRMGTSKALLTCREQTFLDALTTSLKLGGCSPVMAVVSGPPASIQQNCRLDQVRLVVNPAPEQGQISSLRVALRAAPETQGLVVVLVDQGRVEIDTIRRVREALEDATVAVARYQGTPGHPTGFSAEVFDALHSSRADRGARVVVDAEREASRLRYVDVDDPGVIRNINTPDQYRAFLREP